MSGIPDGTETLFALIQQLDQAEGRPAVVLAACELARLSMGYLEGDLKTASLEVLDVAEAWARGRASDGEVWKAIDLASEQSSSTDIEAMAVDTADSAARAAVLTGHDGEPTKNYLKCAVQIADALMNLHAGLRGSYDEATCSAVRAELYPKLEEIVRRRLAAPKSAARGAASTTAKTNRAPRKRAQGVAGAKSAKRTNAKTPKVVKPKAGAPVSRRSDRPGRPRTDRRDR